MIDTRIETFLTLCREMNYRKTAELLNMTQPAVTQHIKYLEKFYGCRLFLYDGKSLHMTEEAQILKQYSENIVYQEKQLKGRLTRQEGCRLAIGATKTIGEYVIAGHISEYLRVPSNHISVNVDNTERLLSALSRGELDFALIEGVFDRTRYRSRLYKQEAFVGLCGKNHPFAEKTVAPGLLWKENLLLREEGSGTRNILAGLLLANNYAFAEFERITTMNSFGLMTRLLEKCSGITFSYRSVGENNAALSEFKVAGWEITPEFHYVFLDTPYSEQAVEFFETFR